MEDPKEWDNEVLIDAIREFEGLSIKESEIHFSLEDGHVLRVMIPFIADNISKISDTMRQFIELTKPAIDEALEVIKEQETPVAEG